MKSEKPAGMATRDTVLKRLNDDEVARVSPSGAAPRLEEGAGHLDLEPLDRGVQKARGTEPAMGRALPRQAVHPDTLVAGAVGTFRKSLAHAGK